MTGLFRSLAAALLALGFASSLAVPGHAAPKITVAVGGADCLCYLPVVLAEQLGAFDRAGVDVELVSFKAASQALTAVLGGSADVVAGYFDHCVNLAAKGEVLQAFVVYDRYPGLALVVSPKHAIASVADLAGKTVGVSAPGSSTDFFLRYLLGRNGVDPESVTVTGIGIGGTAVAGMGKGIVVAAVMLDPALTILQGRFEDLAILVDARTEADTLAVFGSEYPGGVLYARGDWIAKNGPSAQALTNAVLEALDWIAAHSPEEIMARMPEELVGPDKALYLAALRNTIPMYSRTGLMDPRGAEAVRVLLGRSVPEIAKADIDLAKTYTNSFVEKARAGGN